VNEAAGALAVAQAALAKAQAGARPEELTAAEAAVDAASASRDAAQANTEAAAANVDAARGQLATAQAAVDAAQAQLDKAQAGATAEELAIAEHSVEAAKNALWSVQAERDATCGKVGHGATQAACDAGDAATQQAEEEVRIAELQLQQLQNGTRSEDLAALEASLAQAQAGAETAQANLAAAQSTHKLAAAQQAEAEAGLEQAQAQLDLLNAGTRSEDMDALTAQVTQAQAALDGAQASLRGIETQIDRMTLTAPTGGVVTQRTGEVGELISTGVPLLALADLDHLTLTVYIPEADLGQVALGQQATSPWTLQPELWRPGRLYRLSAEFTPRTWNSRMSGSTWSLPSRSPWTTPKGCSCPACRRRDLWGPADAHNDATAES
jgi:multidrug resistance efflux pump